MREVQLPISSISIYKDKLIYSTGNEIIFRDLNSLEFIESSSDFKYSISGITVTKNNIIYIWSKNTFIEAKEENYKINILNVKKFKYSILNIR